MPCWRAAKTISSQESPKQLVPICHSEACVASPPCRKTLKRLQLPMWEPLQLSLWLLFLSLPLREGAFTVPVGRQELGSCALQARGRSQDI